MTREKLLQKIEEAKVSKKTYLNLDNNQLTQLPPEIGQLTNLRTLSLNGNQLTQLSPEIVQLTNLQLLYLGVNQLTQLPPEIVQLTNLQTLSLNGNQLTQLSPEIVQLTNLQLLFLNRNQLTQLPPEIGQLTNLQALYLDGNQLTQLPPEIGQLTNLQTLSLGGNQLTQLPPEIVQLTNLRTLSLDGNQLTQLPPEIVQLTNLRQLYLDEAQLRSWANDIIKLKNLQIGVWEANKYDIIPLELLETFKTGQELINYYYKKREVKLNEAKIMLIGQGNVGKTSVRQRLMNVKDYQSKGRTEGVEINCWILDVKDEEIKINIWDFGGQEIYHTTHQFFFRSRCLYILVLDARAEDRGGNQLNYWLRQTQALGKNAPVIVVINKSEKQDDINGQQNEFDERYQQIKTSVEELQANKFSNIAGCISVSADMNLGFDELIVRIQTTIEKELPAVGTKITEEEAKIKDLLENKKNNYVSDTEFQKICKDIPKDERKKLIELLDALGIITSFDDENLKETIVLKPEWITKGIYKILSSYILGEKNGEVERKDIISIFQDNDEDKKNYPPDKIDYILGIMEKHDLCFLESSGGGKKHLLFPVSFPVKEPNRAPFSQNTTHFEYQYTNIFFDSIIVRFLHYAYQTFGGKKQGNYWRKGVEFFTTAKKNRVLVKADDIENKITIKIDGETSAREHLLGQITAKIDDIHSNFGDLGIEKKIFAPKSLKIQEFDYKTLINRQKNGYDFISATNTDGEELKVSINYLLKGEGEAVIIIEESSLPVIVEEVRPQFPDQTPLINLMKQKAELDLVKLRLDGVSDVVSIIVYGVIVVGILVGIGYIIYWCIMDWETVNKNAQSIGVVVTFILGLLGVSFYLVKRQWFSETKMHDAFENKIDNLLYKRKNFSIETYQNICNQINMMESSREMKEK